jgi:hypothetical protein
MVVVPAAGESGVIEMGNRVSGSVHENRPREIGSLSRPAGPGWIAALLVFLLLAWLTGARAASSPLSADVTPMTLRPRTSAPAYLDIKLHSQSRSPLQGTLEVQGWSSGEMICRQEIADLTLLFGITTQRVLLPPPVFGRTSEEVHLRFHTLGANYDLGRFLTMGETTAARQYIIGLCRPQFGLGEPQNFTWRALRPERVLKEDRSRIGAVATAPVWFAPEDLPSALGLCAFDLVVLEGPALSALSEKQLSDLTTWIEAGGSLCLVAVRDLKAEHRAFLQRLSVSSEDTVAKAPAFLFRRAGLGRVAMIDAPPAGEDQLVAEPWTAATYFLAHTDGAHHPGEPPNRSQWYYQYAVQGELEQEMLRALPHTARMIPLPILGAILTAFVLLVGPGEWILLGKLRRRRWTWATFPVIAIGCTFLTVRTAEHYLGMDDQRVSLIVTDYSPQGKALRENRFDLWFVGRNKDALAEKRQSLSVSCLERNSGRGAGGFRLPVYEGRVPTHYTLRQSLYQWTPYIQRTLAFAPNPTGPSLQWQAIREMPTSFRDYRGYAYDSDSVPVVSEKIGAQDWTVQVFHFDLPRSERPSLIERLSLNDLSAWAFTRSPSGEPGLADLTLDHEPGDMLVVAQRRLGREIQIQRCVYHFDSHE